MGAGGNQNPTKAGIPLCRCRHIFSPTVSSCLVKGKHSSLPYPLTPTNTKHQLKTIQKIEHNLAYMDYAMIFCL